MALEMCYMLFTILVLVLRADASFQLADVDPDSRPVEFFGLNGSNPEQPPAVPGVGSPNTTTPVTELGPNDFKPDRPPAVPGVVSLNTTTAVMGRNSPNGSQAERPPVVLAVGPPNTTNPAIDPASPGKQTLQVPCQGDKCPVHQRQEAMKPVVRSLQSGSSTPYERPQRPCPVCGRQPCCATQCSCHHPRPCCRKHCLQPEPCPCKQKPTC